MATRSSTKQSKQFQPRTAEAVSQKVSQLGFSATQLKGVSPRVRNLSVADLEDFGRLISGAPVQNKNVTSLTATDIKGIEDLFGSYRSQALEAINTAGVRGAVAGRLSESLVKEISVSCCSCTPCCCCCGAADVNPFE